MTVAVETHSNDPEEDSRSRSAPPPETEPLARRQFDYTLSDGETVTEDEFISEPGVYFVEATVNTGESRDVWADYEATAGGLDGTYVSITVNGDGIPVISFPYND